MINLNNHQMKLFIDHIIDRYEALPLEQYKNIFLNFKAALINNRNQVLMTFDNHNVYFTSLDFSDASHKNQDILTTALNRIEINDHKFFHQNAMIMDSFYPFYELDDHYPLLSDQQLFSENMLNEPPYTLFKKAFIDSLKLFKKTYYTYFLEENVEKLNYLDLNEQQRYLKFATILLDIKNSNNEEIEKIVFHGGETKNQLLTYFINYFKDIPRKMFMQQIKTLNLSNIDKYYKDYQYGLLLKRLKNKAISN